MPLRSFFELFAVFGVAGTLVTGMGLVVGPLSPVGQAGRLSTNDR